MSDEQEHVEAGSETSGEQAAAETSHEETAAAETASTEQSGESDAGGAAGETPNAEESRTAFVSGARPGDECTCPDGRTGTVHSFDSGLVCIPNQG